MSGLFDAAGASAGGHAGNWASRSANRVVDLGKQQVPLSGREQQLDQHTETNAARAKELVADYEQQYQDGLITQQEKYNKVIDAWSRCGDQVAGAMMDEIKHLKTVERPRIIRAIEHPRTTMLGHLNSIDAINPAQKDHQGFLDAFGTKARLNRVVHFFEAKLGIQRHLINRNARFFPHFP